MADLSEYFQIKNYFRDIDFCLGKAIIDTINNACTDYPLQSVINQNYLNKEKRFVFYKIYAIEARKQNNNDFEDEQAKTYNKSIKYNDTIVLGDEHFHNLIKKMDIPCENIYYLNEEQLSNFFQVPKKINNKYKKCKYFIIMNEQNGNNYLETIRYLCDVFGIKLVLIIYVQNKNYKINKKILQNPFVHIILTFSENDILNYYYDSYIKLLKNKTMAGI